MTSHVVTLGTCRAELRLGRWEDVLADVTCDALITDPPYSQRNERGHNAASGKVRLADVHEREAIDYTSWDADIIACFVASWSPRVRGWINALTSHDLIPAWENAHRVAGRYVFAPVPCVIRGMTCRMFGDGPSSWAVYSMVARPRTVEAAKWGTLPGAYVVSKRTSGAGGGRGKPLDLMRKIVSDYSRPSDLVCDPCAGYATTLAAALLTGRNAIGAEMDPDAYENACRVLDAVTSQQVLAL